MHNISIIVTILCWGQYYYYYYYYYYSHFTYVGTEDWRNYFNPYMSIANVVLRIGLSRLLDLVKTR